MSGITGYETEWETGTSGAGELASVLAELEGGGGATPSPPTITVPTIYIMAGRPFEVLNLFGFDRSILSSEHTTIISGIACEIVASASSSPVETVVIQGHTDGIGTVDYDFQLGIRRAEAVKKRLRASLQSLRPGITSSVELVSQSSGKDEPAASNSAPACRALNRRVEVFLIRRPPLGGFPFRQIFDFLKKLGIPISLDAVRSLPTRKTIVVSGGSTQNARATLTRGHTLAKLRTQVSAAPQKKRRFTCPCGEGLKVCAVFLPAKICLCATISLFPPKFMIKVCGLLPGPFA